MTSEKKQFSNEDAVAYLQKYTAEDIRIILGGEMTEREFKMAVIETVYFESVRNPECLEVSTRMLRDLIEESAARSFSCAMKKLAEHCPKDGSEVTIFNPEILEILEICGSELDKFCKQNPITKLDYSGLRVMMNKYMKEIDGVHVETPEYVRMRVALLQFPVDLLKQPFLITNMRNYAIPMAVGWVKENYLLQAEGAFTHATPTILNAWGWCPQLASCFLLDMNDDSIDGIFETVKEQALISKSAGGIGVAVHKIRAEGSPIAKTNGHSKGLIPMLRVMNSTAVYADQSGARKGAFAIYLEPHHADFLAFLEIRRPEGPETVRARDLHHAVWISDLFFKRVEADEMWSFFCPDSASGLDEVWGEEYELLYEVYERRGLAKFTMRAREVFERIVDAQIATSEPYIVCKDACNRKSNQKNRGTIKSSNLCTEIVQYTEPGEIAVCNLASIGLPVFLKDGVFNFERMHKVVKKVTYYLDNNLDKTYYPVEACRKSNDAMRPLGIGVQGLADVYAAMELNWGDAEAIALGQDIFETIYHAFLEASSELAQKRGVYPYFKGSPASKGVLQFDMWGFKPSSRYNWESLRKKIVKVGLRNSHGVAPMPTATTSLILGNTESFQPFTSILSLKKAISGEHLEINPHLLRDLKKRGLFDDELMQELKAADNSVQKIDRIPPDLKLRYRTAFEIPEKVILKHLKVMAPFVDQSMSRNTYFLWDDGSGIPLRDRVASSHFASWKAGLKTICYYVHKQQNVRAPKMTVSTPKTRQSPQMEDGGSCSMDEGCFSCGS